MMIGLPLSILLQTAFCFMAVAVAIDEDGIAYQLHRDSHYSGLIYLKPEELGDAAKCREVCANKAGHLTQEATAKFCIGYAKNCTSYKYFGRWGHNENFEMHLWCIYACNFVDKVEKTTATKLLLCQDGHPTCKEHLKIEGTFNNFKFCLRKCDGWANGKHSIKQDASVCDEHQTECWPLKYFHEPGVTDAFTALVHCMDDCYVATYEDSIVYYLHRDSHYSGLIYLKPEELGDADKCREVCANKAGHLTQEATANFCKGSAKTCTSYKYFGRWGHNENFEMHLWCIYACNFVDKVEKTNATKLLLCEDGNPICNEHLKIEGTFNNYKFCLSKCDGWANGKQSIKQEASVCDEHQTECWPLKYFNELGVTNAFTALVHCMDDCYETNGQDIIAYYLHRDSHNSRRMYFKPEELENAAKCREVCAHKGDLSEEAKATFCIGYAKNCTSYKYFGRWGHKENFEMHLRCIYACNFVDKVDKTTATKLLLCDDGDSTCITHSKIDGSFSDFKFCLNKCDGRANGTHTIMRQVSVYDEQKTEYWPLKYFHAPGETDAFTAMIECLDGCYVANDQDNIAYYVHRDPQYSGRMFFKPKELGDAAECREICANKAGGLTEEATADFCVGYVQNCTTYEYFGRWGYYEDFELHLRCIYACNFVDKVEMTSATKLKLCNADKKKCMEHSKIDGTYNNFKFCLNKCDGWANDKHTVKEDALVCDENQTECWRLTFFYEPKVTDAFNAMVQCFDDCYEAKYDHSIAYYLHRDTHYSKRMYLKHDELGGNAKCQEICANKGGDLTEEATAKFCMAYAKNCISYKYFGRWGYDENFELHLWCIHACNFVDKVEKTLAAKLMLCDDGELTCITHSKIDRSFSNFKFCMNECDGWKNGNHSSMQEAFVCDEDQTECWLLNYFQEPGVTDAFTALVHCLDDCHVATDQIIKAYYVHRDSYYSGRMFFKPKELGDAAECREICASKAGDLTEEATAEFCVGYAQKCNSYEYFGRWGYYENFDQHLRCIYACNFVNKVEKTHATKLKICNADKQICMEHSKIDGTFKNFKFCLNKCKGWTNGNHTVKQEAFVCDEKQTECLPFHYFHEPKITDAFNATVQCFHDCYGD